MQNLDTPTQFTHRVGMVPFAPKGTCIGSIKHISQILSFGETFKNARRNTSVGMAIGLHAGDVSDTTNAAFTSDKLLMHHSVAPLIGSLLDQEAERDLLMMIRSGTPYRSLVKHFDRGPLVSRCIRRCPICVADDEAKYGAAFWRVAHQLLPIHYCSTHNVMLEEMCGNCGTPYAERSKPAGISLASCSRCGSREGSSPSYWLHKQPEAYRRFESLVERSIRGESEELRPATRLATFTTAVNSCDGSTTELVDMFFKWWGVERIEDLRSWFGAALTHELLHDILRGRRWVDPAFVLIAVTSFAMEWARQRNAGAQEPLQFSSRQCDHNSGQEVDLDKQLVGFSRKAGLPERLVQEIINGNVFKKSTHREAETIGIRRFLDSLPKDIRTAIAERHTLAKLQQDLVTEAINLGPAAPIQSKKRNSPLWTWLQAQIPDCSFTLRSERSLKTAREEFASNIEILLMHRPTASLMDLRRQDVQLHRFLQSFDESWLRAKKVEFKQASHWGQELARGPKYRADFLISARDPSLSHRPISQRSPRAYAWLRAHDPAWLKQQVMSMKVSERDRRIQENRTVVINILDQGIRSRMSFMKAHWILYKWMLQNDRLWFDEHIPCSRTSTTASCSTLR